MSAPDDLIAGRYRLVRRVGSGAMGVVWEAWDDRLHRAVAVKQLHAQLGLSDADTELATLRAMREARITARLDHPNAVPVFDVVEHEGRPCLIMQFLPSEPLSTVLKRRTSLPALETARIGGQVASALAAAHQVGIVHRDVKPGNILITEDGTARISDFGISHALGDATLTSTGLVHGTPAFMAPEIARGGDPSAAADVFGLGATLYAMLEGTPPFGTDPNSIALLHRVASGQFAAPREGGAVTPLLLQMLAVEPDDRPTMAEVAQYLGSLTAPSADATPTLALHPEATAVLPPAAEASTPTPVIPVPPAHPWRSVASAPPPASPSSAQPSSTQPASAQPSSAQPASDPPPSASTASTLLASASPPSSPPPSSAGSPDASDPPAKRPIRVVLLVAAIVAIAAVALALVLPLLRPDGITATPEPSTSSNAEPAPSTSVPSPTTPSESAPSESASTEPSPSTTTAKPSPSETPSPTQSRTPSASSTPTDTSDGAATAEQLEGALTGYYARMPKEVNDSWDLLTRSYQQGQSGGRKSYKRFWGDIERVSVSEVKGNAPDQVEATVVYTFDDGRVSTERTSYRMVNEDGTLKIDSSKVLSSSTR